MVLSSKARASTENRRTQIIRLVWKKSSLCSPLQAGDESLREFCVSFDPERSFGHVLRSVFAANHRGADQALAFIDRRVFPRSIVRRSVDRSAVNVVLERFIVPIAFQQSYPSIARRKPDVSKTRARQLCRDVQKRRGGDCRLITFVPALGVGAFFGLLP